MQSPKASMVCQDSMVTELKRMREREKGVRSERYESSLDFSTACLSQDDIFFAFASKFLEPRWTMGCFPLERVSKVDSDPSGYERKS